jgi:flagellar secretion chaperone FliS
MQIAYGNPADQYLTQKISAANPEQLMALLLEGARRFTDQAVAAMQRRDVPSKARLVNRVSSIIEELMVRLNHEDGGELVENLTRIYEWWLHELFDGSQFNQPERLRKVAAQMESIQKTWEELGSRRMTPSQAALIQAEGLVG